MDRFEHTFGHAERPPEVGRPQDRATAWEPFSISGVCPDPVHRVLMNWDPSSLQGGRLGPTMTDMTERGCYI